MKVFSVLALALCAMFFMVLVSEPVLANAKKNSNGNSISNNGNGNQDKDKKQDKSQKQDKDQNQEKDQKQNGDQLQNQNQEKDKEQDKKQEQIRINTQNPDVPLKIERTYLDLKGVFPIFPDLEFQVKETFLYIDWVGKTNDENYSANNKNYHANIDDGEGNILFKDVTLDGIPIGDIEVIIVSIEEGNLNEQTTDGCYDIYLRAKSMEIKLLIGEEEITYVLEHPMIKIQNGELQFVKLDNGEIFKPQLAPSKNTANKKYTTFGKIKSAI